MALTLKAAYGSKVAKAIAQGRAEQEVAQEREDRLRRLRDEMITLARCPEKRLV
jgi:hypothetical protein